LCYPLRTINLRYQDNHRVISSFGYDSQVHSFKNLSSQVTTQHSPKPLVENGV
jgi:hypothetical protein